MTNKTNVKNNKTNNKNKIKPIIIIKLTITIKLNQ